MGLSLVPVLQKARFRAERAAYSTYCRSHPVKERTALLASNRQRSLSGNLAYIAEALAERSYQVDYLYLPGIHPAAGELSGVMAEIAAARYLIIDDFFQLFYALDLRPETEFIQVWHAVGAFKKFGYARIGTPEAPDPHSLTHKNYTAAITSATGLTGVYAESFGIPEERIYPTGVPRTDLFFREDKRAEAIRGLEKAHPELAGRKLILFAPTFRGKGRPEAHYPAAYFPIDQFAASLREGETLILRQHPFVKDRLAIPEQYRDRVIDLSAYPDINGLLLKSSLLITDYSSVIFEAALAGLATIFYVPDLDEYAASRDFYYPFREYLTGPAVSGFPELLAAVREAKKEPERIAALKSRFMDRCDGKATERFVDEVIEKRAAQ